MRFPNRIQLLQAVAWPIAILALPVYRYRWQRANRDGGLSFSNDPNWGKRGSQEGPPDLDEILRKFNQKLAGIFGSGKPPGGDGGGGGGERLSANAIGGGFALAAGIAVSVWLATGFYIVDQGKKGVELRLGRYTQTTDAGPRWHWPYPIETAEVVDALQVRSIEVGHRNSQKTKMPDEALMLTEDQNIVDVQFSVQFNLKNPEDYIFNNKDPDEAVRQVAETAMREVVGKSKMDHVLYEGRGDIAARVKALMQSILDRYKTGINITGVNMQNAQPPEQVQASFNDAVRAKQDKERLKNEGEAYANDIIPKAKGRAAALLEEANGHKQRVIATAQGDASRFSQLLAEYEKAPGVTRERLYLDTMQQVLQGTSKVIVDQKGGNSLLYLPLDKLFGSTGAPAPEPPRVATPAEAPAPPIEARRDLRNR